MSMSYYLEHRDAFLEGLKTFLRIPSISTLPEHLPDIRRAAEFVRDEFREAGLNSAELIEGPGNPLVYAEWTGAPGKPTLLLYGHYDVQPPDPLDEWKSPPFEPSIRGEDLFARGASDDKGQTYILIKAVEGFLKTAGRLPINVKFLIEGREQIVRAGEALAIPPHAPHGVEVLEDAIVVDVFSPAREDWIRGDDAYLRG